LQPTVWERRPALERGIEYTYLSITDIAFSVPFFSHQNRITADLFGLALQPWTPLPPSPLTPSPILAVAL